jgi:hypothetical protein
VSEVPAPVSGPDYPFLILDVREPDLYAKSHLALAHSYPAIRSQKKKKKQITAVLSSYLRILFLF